MKPPDAIRLVIADDSHAVQSALANAFNKMRHILLAGQAFDVPQTILRIHETRAEIVILDLDMPGGSGFDVLKALSSAGVAPVIIVFSFHLSESLRKCCLILGAQACLRKPDDAETLINAISAMTRPGLDELRSGTLTIDDIAASRALHENQSNPSNP